MNSVYNLVAVLYWIMITEIYLKIDTVIYFFRFFWQTSWGEENFFLRTKYIEKIKM